MRLKPVSLNSLTRPICSAMLIGLIALTSTTASAQQKTIVETAASADQFKTLVAAVKAAGLVDALNGNTQFTVFAPTDAAFANLPKGTLDSLLLPENKEQLQAILKYHVVPGRITAADAFEARNTTTLNGQRLAVDFQKSPLMIGNAKIVKTDIPCRNGVIHVIDTVLLPSTETIPATTSNASQFETLLAAVGEAGLADVLSSKGPFTVFAPTDEAFGKLPKGTVESLLKKENRDKLTAILKYHVVAGRVYASDAVKAKRASTLQGSSIKVSLDEKGIKINKATVLTADVETSNGVIHIIDSVLLPDTSKMSHHQTIKLLSDAIDKGAPIFNGGDHHKCCDIYMTAMTQLQNRGIDGSDKHMMGDDQRYNFHEPGKCIAQRIELGHSATEWILCCIEQLKCLDRPYRFKSHFNKLGGDSFQEAVPFSFSPNSKPRRLVNL